MFAMFRRFLYSKRTAPYVFVLPFIFIFSIFWIYPLGSGIWMSFHSISFNNTKFVELANYTKLLRDKFFANALRNSLQYMGLTISLLIPFPLLFAVLMDSSVTRAKNVWKAVMYMPALASVVVAGMLFRLMFSELPGSQMNQIVTAFGGEPIKWLFKKETAWTALLMLCCWRWTGVNMLYFLSGLKSIDDSLYEAAKIDGCGPWQEFWRIKLPLLKPTIVYVVTISVYAGLAMFLESYMLWNGNDSPLDIGLTIVGYLYKRGIEQNNLGYASSVGVVLMGIALLINVTQLTLTGTFKKERD